MSGPPRISVHLAVQPSRIPQKTSVPTTEEPTITLTVTLYAEQPITIFTWPTVFNLELSQKRKSFACQDLTSGEPVHLELTKGPKRPGFSREEGGRDDKYFCELEPMKEETFSGPLKIVRRETLVAGHRYRLSISQDEAVKWWRYGRRRDVLAPRGQPAPMGEASGPPIVLDVAGFVEFEIEAD